MCIRDSIIDEDRASKRVPLEQNNRILPGGEPIGLKHLFHYQCPMGKIVISGKEHALQEQKEIKAGQREKDQGRRHEIPVLLPVMEGAKRCV